MSIVITPAAVKRASKMWMEGKHLDKSSQDVLIASKNLQLSEARSTIAQLASELVILRAKMKG